MMVLTYNAKMIFILPSGGIKYHLLLGRAGVRQMSRSGAVSCLLR